MTGCAFRRLSLFLMCGGLLLSQQSPVEKAWDLAGKGKRDEAIGLLRTAIQNEPNNADARLLLGSLLMESGDRSESIAELREGARLRPKSAAAQNALGEAYMSFGMANAAGASFERAVAIEPKLAAAQVNLGQILVDSREYDAAAAHLDIAMKLLAKNPDAADAHYLRAKVYAAKDELRDAVGQLERAIALRPNFPQAWSDLGQLRKTLLDGPGALAAFERAVALNPRDAVAQYRLGAEYLRQDKVPPAVESLEEAYELAPADQSTLNALQAALRRDGQTAKAEEIKGKLTELLRNKDRAKQNALIAIELNNEGANFEKRGDMSAAASKYREAVNLFPEHVGIRVNYAVALLRLGKWSEGLNELHRASVEDPENPKIEAALQDALKQAPPGSIPHWSDQQPESFLDRSERNHVASPSRH